MLILNVDSSDFKTFNFVFGDLYQLTLLASSNWKIRTKIDLYDFKTLA